MSTRVGKSVTALAALILVVTSAKAEVKFRCLAGSGQECAFTVFDDKGATNFVLAPYETHGLNDNTVGMKLCVRIGPKGIPNNSYPGCWLGRRVRAGDENMSFPSISGTWVDKNGRVFSVTQTQETLKFTGTGWTPGNGKFESVSGQAMGFSMTWPQYGRFTATVGGDERHITWSNGQVWTKR